MEQEDIVAVSVRFLHDDQGEMIGNVYRVLDEVVDLCYGARGLNLQAIEARRRDLELDAREHVGPINAAGHAHPAVEEEAVDTAGGGKSGGEVDPFGLDRPVVVVGPPDELGRHSNRRINPTAAGYELLVAAGQAYLAERGLRLAPDGDSEDDAGEDNESVGSGWGRP